MHLCMKIPRHTSKNPIAAGDFKWIFARNCEGTEQLQRKSKRKRGQQLKMILSPFFFYYLISAEISLNLGCMDVSISSKRIAS